jgi:hypothetical protein
MKNEINHEPALQPESIFPPESTSLAEILSPLVDLLNTKYPAGYGEDYEINQFGQFGRLERNPDEEIIELPDSVLRNEASVRAVMTLLWRSGSNNLWTESRFGENDPYRTPLRFSYVKRVFWMETHWQWNRYIVVDFFEELDEAAAARQVNLLVNALSDRSMLLPLTNGDVMQF